MTEQGIASAELREVHEGTLTENLRTYPLAPFLESEALNRYIYIKNRYSHIKRLDENGDLPATFEQSKYCQRLVAAHGSALAQTAVRDGSLPVLSWLTGLTHRDTDFSTAQLLQSLLAGLRRPGWMSIFAGSTDGGKTNTSLLLAGLALRDDPDMRLLTNISTLDWHEPGLNSRTHFVENLSELRDLADSDTPDFVLLDEMSTQANAATANYEVNSELYPLITAKSKLNLRLVLIGHRKDGKDIAPSLQAHATYFIKQLRKTRDLENDLYCAEFYDAVRDGEPVDHNFTLEPVPAVSAFYDPDETAVFHLTQ